MTKAVNRKLWGGRFEGEASDDLQSYWNSISFDWVLAPYDIAGSIAHAKMLAKCGIIKEEEANQLVQGLKELLNSFDSGELHFSQSDEDVHMNIERLLHEKIGAVAGKLHTARSRNDQVALDVHLFVRDKCLDIAIAIETLQKTFIEKAEENLEVILPGYTHLQRAQPVLLSHHLLSYVDMLSRDAERFLDCFKRTNISPLGAGALAGTTFPIDREFVSQLLGFDGIYHNSMDAVSDRDFVVEFISAAALCIVHLSRFCEEVILWSSSEFGFVVLDDAFSSGSSMMPQKKNPDLAELVRGKTGRVVGSLVSLLTTLKGLPLTYNKDMQEDKEPLFDVSETILGALRHLAGMTKTLRLNSQKMKEAAQGNFTNATDLADYLAKKGVPFREAHEIVGRVVKSCISNGVEIDAFSLGELKKYAIQFEEDVFNALKVETIVNNRTSQGGTAKSSVLNQITFSIKTLLDRRAKVKALKEKITI